MARRGPDADAEPDSATSADAAPTDSDAAPDTERRVRLVPVAGDWSTRVHDELAATDWAATPVVDVVHYAPATSVGLEDGRPRTEVHRHADPPRPAHYATPERPCRVERVTRPLAEQTGLVP
jgi:hypothetical protein